MRENGRPVLRRLSEPGQVRQFTIAGHRKGAGRVTVPRQAPDGRILRCPGNGNVPGGGTLRTFGGLSQCCAGPAGGIGQLGESAEDRDALPRLGRL
jgi:hypothetical protein